MMLQYQDSRICGFRQEDCGFPIQAYVKHVTPRAGQFLAQGHNLTRFGRGPLDGATFQ